MSTGRLTKAKEDHCDFSQLVLVGCVCVLYAEEAVHIKGAWKGGKENVSGVDPLY